MPTIIDVEEMLVRREPVTQEEWVKILECVTDMLRPILKRTTLPRLCDISIKYPELVSEVSFFHNQGEAESVISCDNACERGITTEGIFFFADWDKWMNVGDNTTTAPVLGLTRNGKWVRGLTGWTVPNKPWMTIKHVNFFGLSATDPDAISRAGDFPIPDVIEVLITVLRNMISSKKDQLYIMENAEKRIWNVYSTARSIPTTPRT